MANSGAVTSGQQATAAQYNNLRSDVVDPGTGHDHTGATDHGVLLPKGRAVYGDGSDGDVTISGNTTLTRSMYYNNLTINSGVTLFPVGFAIYVKGTLTVNGTISTKGNDGVGSTIGAQIWTNASSCYAPGLQGGSPGSAANGSACPYGQSGFAGGMGGLGGNSPGYTGGGAGSTGLPFMGAHAGIGVLGGVLLAASTVIGAGGGLGGGGGAGTNGYGGGGGGGGGPLFIAARNVVVGATGVITSRGGNGGNAPGTNAGGGGGGGGGPLMGCYDTMTNAGTITSAGGAGGSGVGTGSVGGTGGSGTFAFIQQ